MLQRYYENLEFVIGKRRWGRLLCLMGACLKRRSPSQAGQSVVAAQAFVVVLRWAVLWHSVSFYLFSSQSVQLPASRKAAPPMASAVTANAWGTARSPTTPRNAWRAATSTLMALAWTPARPVTITLRAGAAWPSASARSCTTNAKTPGSRGVTLSTTTNVFTNARRGTSWIPASKCRRPQVKELSCSSGVVLVFCVLFFLLDRGFVFCLKARKSSWCLSVCDNYLVYFNMICKLIPC